MLDAVEHAVRPEAVGDPAGKADGVRPVRAGGQHVRRLARDGVAAVRLALEPMERAAVGTLPGVGLGAQADPVAELPAGRLVPDDFPAVGMRPAGAEGTGRQEVAVVLAHQDEVEVRAGHDEVRLAEDHRAGDDLHGIAAAWLVGHRRFGRVLAARVVFACIIWDGGVRVRVGGGSLRSGVVPLDLHGNGPVGGGRDRLGGRRVLRGGGGRGVAEQQRGQGRARSREADAPGPGDGALDGRWEGAQKVHGGVSGERCLHGLP